MTPKQWAAWAFESVTGWSWHRELSREDGAVYMDRWQLLKTGLLSVYINRINLPDYDELLHNHPWKHCYSVKLWNYYEEQVPGPEFRVPGRFSRIPEQHRITYLGGEKPVWTLFIGWRSTHKWGFIAHDGAVISWRDRLVQRGIDPDQNERGH